MTTVDLRSDTVTKPTPEMRESMHRAEVGDDVYGEDPTVNQLQELSARTLGKEAALLVPSGTMGNLASILAHCGRGDEVILGDRSHTHLYEAGGIAVVGGIHPRTVVNQSDGTLRPEEVRDAVRPDDVHHPVTRLVSLENTHNRCGGAALPVEYGIRMRALADEYDLKLHLDGARLFNAAAALGVTAAELAAPFDSVTFCLSKGLCAPVGSVIVGDRAFIRRAHRVRKLLGGGMRQAGVIAAAGIVGLETIVPRLAEDHQRAGRLARALAAIPGLRVDTEDPPTNMVYLDLTDDVPADASKVRETLVGIGVLVGVVGARRFRLVTHYWINDEGVERAVEAFGRAVAGA